MTIRIHPKNIEVPNKNPFEYDRLDRKKAVEALATIIETIESPIVIGIDANWGNGKTTFLRMLDKSLSNRGLNVVNFNAWDSDYSSDPFTALTTELYEGLNRLNLNDEKGIKQKIKEFRKVAEKVMKKKGPSILQALLAKIPFVGDVLGKTLKEFLNTYGVGQMSNYLSQREAVNQFKQTLSEVSHLVDSSSGRSILVVMIDELDRCRPSFAVELLENAKHIFSVDNVIFVLAVNRIELANSIQALYGTDFDARDYLGRFFDVDFKLPNPDREHFISEIVNSVGIRGYLDRTKDTTGSTELRTLESLLIFFFKEPSISFRSIEQSVHRLGLVYGSLPDNEFFLGTTIAILLILRTIDRELYYEFIHGKSTDQYVVQQILDRFGYSISSEQPQEVAVFEAWLIAMQIERDDRAGGPEDDGPISTPLYKYFAEMASGDQRRSDALDREDILHADKVLKLVNIIRSDSKHYDGVLRRAAVDRMELLSIDVSD